MLILNLLSEKYKAQYRFEIKKRLFIFVILSLCICVVIFTLLLFSHYVFLRTHERALNISLDVGQSDKQMEYIARTEKNISDINMKLDVLTKIRKDTVSLAPVIESMSLLIPAGLRVRNMSLNAQTGGVSIDGFSTTRGLILHLGELLSRSNIVAKDSLYSPINNILKDKKINFRFSFTLPLIK